MAIEVWVDSEEMDYYESFYNELLKALSSNSKRNSNADSQNNPSHANSQNQSGSGDSGLSSGDYSINSNGVLSGSSGSAGVSASSSAGPSPSSSVPESASAKTLSIDDETFRVIGVGGLVILIILVIGLYYREDIIEMMKE